jgi:hypothetical protein
VSAGLASKQADNNDILRDRDFINYLLSDIKPE